MQVQQTRTLKNGSDSISLNQCGPFESITDRYADQVIVMIKLRLAWVGAYFRSGAGKRCVELLSSVFQDKPRQWINAWETARQWINAWETARQCINAWKTARQYINAWKTTRQWINAWEIERPWIDAWKIERQTANRCLRNSKTVNKCFEDSKTVFQCLGDSKTVNRCLGDRNKLKLHYCFIFNTNYTDKVKHFNMIKTLTDFEIDRKFLLLVKNLYWKQHAAKNNI